MSATRENRNAGAVEDASAMVGAAITTLENLVDAVSYGLPDDFPNVVAQLAALREAHADLQEVLGV